MIQSGTCVKDKTCRRSKHSGKGRRRPGSHPSACAQRSENSFWGVRQLRTRLMRRAFVIRICLSLSPAARPGYWTLGLCRCLSDLLADFSFRHVVSFEVVGHREVHLKLLIAAVERLLQCGAEDEGDIRKAFCNTHV